MSGKVKVATSEGTREYLSIQDSNEFDAAREAGEIVAGQEIIYRTYVVYVLEDYGMLILSRVHVMGGPQFVSPTGGWQASPDGMQWSFTVNGQPADPSQFMGK